MNLLTLRENDQDQGKILKSKEKEVTVEKDMVILQEILQEITQKKKIIRDQTQEIRKDHIPE